MNDDLDHDVIQCRGLALLMESRDTLFTGPDEELYRVDPKIMPETFVAPIDGIQNTDGMMFFLKTPQAQTVMTWVNVLTGDRKRFADSKMDPYANPNSRKLQELNGMRVKQLAREWFRTYGQDLTMPSCLSDNYLQYED